MVTAGSHDATRTAASVLAFDPDEAAIADFRSERLPDRVKLRIDAVDRVNIPRVRPTSSCYPGRCDDCLPRGMVNALHRTRVAG